jgi:hypothetical protein
MTTEPNQADIMAAMQAGQFRSKAPSNTSLYADIESSALTQEAEGSKTNARKIYCFREGCGSVILQKGAASYVESSSTIVSMSLTMSIKLISAPERLFITFPLFRQEFSWILARTRPIYIRQHWILKARYFIHHYVTERYTWERWGGGKGWESEVVDLC